MKCDRCGKEFPDTELYCDRCGKAVFPEYMDEDDIWAYYKTDEELEEILRAEQGDNGKEPVKSEGMMRIPKIKEETIEEPIQENASSEETLQEEVEVPSIEKELEEEAETETEEKETIQEEEDKKLVSEEGEENIWEEDLFDDEEEDEDEKIPLSPQKKKERRKITFLVILILLLCLGIGIALGMKRMKDLDRQEKEYYEKLHKEVVHQDTPAEATQEEVEEEPIQDAPQQEETPKQEYFQFVNPDEVDFSQYQKIVPVSTEQNSIKQSDTYDYSAQSTVDGDISTSWQENENGTGETTGIQLNFDGNHKVRYLVLYLGNWRSDQLWEYNARPKNLTIQVGDSQTKDVEFSNEKKKFCLSFEEPLDASHISIYIASAYEGSRWDDNGISEVEVYE